MSNLKHLYRVKITLKPGNYGTCDEYIVVVSSADAVSVMFADIAENVEATHIGVADEDLSSNYPDGIVLGAVSSVV